MYYREIINIIVSEIKENNKRYFLLADTVRNILMKLLQMIKARIVCIIRSTNGFQNSRIMIISYKYALL